MIHSESAPVILIACILLLVLSGLVTLVWGRRLPRKGDWLVGFFLVLLLGGVIFSGNLLIEEGVRAKIWLRGWIWPYDNEGAVTAGIIRDPVGLVMAGLATAFSGILLLSQRALKEQPRLERFFSAVAFGAAGAALSWISYTPWLSFVGLALVIFAGFLALGSRWDSDEESALAIRFGCERSFGLLLSVLGACGIAGGRAALHWSVAGGEAATWITQNETLSFSEIAGATLLITGLLVQLSPFPFLGWVVAPSKTSPYIRIPLTQVLPAWAAFAILVRLQPQLGTPAIFMVFGWLMLASTVLAVISGLLQSNWRGTLGAWVSSGTTLSVSILCLANVEPALSLMIGLSLGATAFAIARSALEVFSEDDDEDASRKNRALWAKILVFLAVCSATGLIGFISAGGGVHWIHESWKDPALAAAALTVFALFAMLGWKLAWMSSREPSGTSAHWSAILVPFLLPILAFGIIWNGSVSGGALPSDVDHVWQSLMELFFRNTRPINSDDPSFVPVAGAYWGALIVAIGAAYWASVKIHAPSEDDDRFSAKLFRFVVSGYGSDRAAARFLDGVSWLSVLGQRAIDGKLWGKWIPWFFSTAIGRLASTVSRADQAISVQTRRVMRHWIDGPAKFLQLIQNGDVQWYILFAVGSGLAILIHYLWIAGNGVIN